jgi:hypothetical protein
MFTLLMSADISELHALHAKVRVSTSKFQNTDPLVWSERLPFTADRRGKRRCPQGQFAVFEMQVIYRNGVVQAKLTSIEMLEKISRIGLYTQATKCPPRQQGSADPYIHWSQYRHAIPSQRSTAFHHACDCPPGQMTSPLARIFCSGLQS